MRGQVGVKAPKLLLQRSIRCLIYRHCFRRHCLSQSSFSRHKLQWTPINSLWFSPRMDLPAAGGWKMIYTQRPSTTNSHHVHTFVYFTVKLVHLDSASPSRKKKIYLNLALLLSISTTCVIEVILLRFWHGQSWVSRTTNYESWCSTCIIHQTYLRLCR